MAHEGYQLVNRRPINTAIAAFVMLVVTSVVIFGVASAASLLGAEGDIIKSMCVAVALFGFLIAVYVVKDMPATADPDATGIARFPALQGSVAGINTLAASTVIVVGLYTFRALARQYFVALGIPQEYTSIAANLSVAAAFIVLVGMVRKIINAGVEGSTGEESGDNEEDDAVAEEVSLRSDTQGDVEGIPDSNLETDENIHQ